MDGDYGGEAVEDILFAELHLSIIFIFVRRFLHENGDEVEWDEEADVGHNEYLHSQLGTVNHLPVAATELEVDDLYLENNHVE